MGSALAAALVASLLQLASLDADVGLRAEARSSTLATSGTPDATRAALSAVPSATAIADVWRVSFTGRYAPRLWTSDVEAQSSPLVNHAVEARLGTHHEEPWRAEATAGALRGRTDPLADPLRAGAVAPGGGQVATTRPLHYEALRARVAGELPVDLRTTVAAGAAWQASRAIGSDAGLLPRQRGASLDVSLAHLYTERDTLQLFARAAVTLTGAPAGEARTAHSTALSTWRRRLSPYLDGWVGGGASLLYSDQRPADRRYEVRPAGEAGLSRRGEALRVTVDAVSRATTFVDRLTGEVSPVVEVECALGWRASGRLSLTTSASGGARTDGETALARADARLSWALRESLRLDVGATGRWQHERRTERPSFVEAGAFVGVAFVMERLFHGGEPTAPAARDGAGASASGGGRSVLEGT